MGNQTGSASGSAGGGGMMAGANAGQQAGFQAGAGMMQQGMGQQQNMESMVANLARMGPPPAMNTAGAPPNVGQDIVGKYGANMRPPNVNSRSRQDNQLNPSVGQLLSGRG